MTCRFTFTSDKKTCLLLTDCEVLDEICDECISGESRCKFGEEGFQAKIEKASLELVKLKIPI